MDNNKFHYFRKRITDRYDGWRVRKIDTSFRVLPYFLRTRIDAQNFFEERIPIDHIDAFIKEHKEEMPELSLMHIVMAAMVRLISQRPNLNRFVIWNKIFARNHMNFSLAIKRSLTDNGEESMIKPYFQPTDTLQDVVRKVNAELDKNKAESNKSDALAGALGKLPDFLFRTVVLVLLWLDKIGFMPKAVNKVSPFHCTMFLTNLGSIGIESIYHHLYEFGTCSIFLAMGRKSRDTFTDLDGNVQTQKSILLKFVLDERVCDGYYYASSMRQLQKIFMNPEQLLTPPDKVVLDEGVTNQKITK